MDYIWHSKAVKVADKTKCLKVLLNNYPTSKVYLGTYSELRTGLEIPPLINKSDIIPSEQQNKEIADFINSEKLAPEIAAICVLVPKDKSVKVVVNCKCDCPKLSPYLITVWEMIDELLAKKVLNKANILNIRALFESEVKPSNTSLSKYQEDKSFKKLYQRWRP